MRNQIRATVYSAKIQQTFTGVRSKIQTKTIIKQKKYILHSHSQLFIAKFQSNNDFQQRLSNP